MAFDDVPRLNAGIEGCGMDHDKPHLSISDGVYQRSPGDRAVVGRQLAQIFASTSLCGSRATLILAWPPTGVCREIYLGMAWRRARASFAGNVF